MKNNTSSIHRCISIVRSSLSVTGFWYAKNRKEWWTMNAIFSYTLVAISIALGIQSIGIYYCWGDFYEFTYSVCSAAPVTIVLLKMCTFSLNRKKLMQFIEYTHENLWNSEYEDFEKEIIEEVNAKALRLMCSFMLFVLGTVLCYAFIPLFENAGKNVADRNLPFKLWIDIPSTTTPYYEILYIIECLSLVHTAICFSSFDNLLCLLNLNVTGQFQILQHKFETIYDNEKNSNLNSNSLNGDDYLREKLRKYVERHNALIEYVKNVENIFTYTTLFQLIISSVMLCVVAFQVLLSQETVIRKILFYAQVFGCSIQIYGISLTANEVLVASQNVGSAAFRANWQTTSPRSVDRSIRKGLLMVMIRAMRPCYLTAGGFVPVSLATFTTVMNTAFSYLALLRNLTDETV